jgi:post-segregation antitoxin (ccd killing protein)
MAGKRKIGVAVDAAAQEAIAEARRGAWLAENADAFARAGGMA